MYAVDTSSESVSTRDVGVLLCLDFLSYYLLHALFSISRSVGNSEALCRYFYMNRVLWTVW